MRCNNDITFHCSYHSVKRKRFIGLLGFCQFAGGVSVDERNETTVWYPRRPVPLGSNRKVIRISNRHWLLGCQYDMSLGVSKPQAHEGFYEVVLRALRWPYQANQVHDYSPAIGRSDTIVFRSCPMRSAWFDRRSIKDRKGVAALEFALIAPVLMLMIFGMATFGFALNNYLTLTNAVRTGARTLASSRASSTPYSSATSAIYGSAPTLTSASIAITMTVNGSPCTSDAGCSTTLSTSAGSPSSVSATYPCNLSVMGFNFAPTCSLTSSTTERVE
jgi:Flp pilus assembly protein TadG